MKFIKLLNSVEKYFKLCSASIRSDMAKRIMLSTLPNEQINEITLSVAAEGRKDIIKYGTIACVNEMIHYNIDDHGYYKNYNKDSKLKSHDISNLDKAIMREDYKRAINICKIGFSDSSCWGSYFGGSKWLSIANSLYNLIELDERLETERRGSEERIKTLREIVVELNVFDGLSHNTTSIMKNLINHEILDDDNKNTRDIESRRHDEFKKILHMMDVKELEDPLAVYREIEDSLYEAGGSAILGFPDNPHRGKILLKKDEIKAKEELKLIRMRKILNNNLSEINKMLKDLLQLKEKEKESTKDSFSHMIYTSFFNSILRELEEILANLRYNLSIIRRSDKEIFNAEKVTNLFNEVDLADQFLNGKNLNDFGMNGNELMLKLRDLLLTIKREILNI